MKPYLNLGCGKIRLPATQPEHHSLVDAEIYRHPAWHNVDVTPAVEPDECVDIFRYPWPWSKDSYDGALLSNIAEHIPHGSGPVDGFFEFFAELWRVLSPGSLVHVLVPYARSDAAFADPSHTRYLLPITFSYLCKDFEDSPYDYQLNSRWEIVEEPSFAITDECAPLLGDNARLYEALRTQWNVAREFYIKLRVVK